MKYLITISLCLFTIQPAQGQEFEWAKVKPTHISTNPFLFKHSVAIDTAGQPVYARMIKKKLTYGTIYMGDFSLEKYDASGNHVRSDTLTGKIYIKNILTDRSNNLIVYGSFRDSIWVDSTNHLIIPGGNNHEFILKLEGNGNPIWINDYTQIDPDIYNITTVAIDNTDTIWIGVQTLSNSSLIKKLDANGNTTTTHTQTNVLSISGMAFDDSGNLWVTGATSSGNQSFNGYNANGPFTYSFYVTRYSPSGIANWVQFIEDVTFQTPQIVCDNSGNAYLSDQLLDAFTFGSITAQGPEWVYDFYLTKIDTGGNFIWLREIPAGNSSADASIGMQGFLTYSNGNIYLAGFSRNSINWGNGIISDSFGYDDIIVLNYSTNGDLLWAKNAGGTSLDRSEAIAVDKNGNCYITGIVGDNAAFDSLAFTGEYSNSFLAKLKPDDITSIGKDQVYSPQDFILYQNYPNPFNPTTTIEFSLPQTEFVTLKIYNILCEEVTILVSERLTAGKYKYEWDASSLASGVYLYRLEAGKDSRKTKKLVLLK